MSAPTRTATAGIIGNGTYLQYGTIGSSPTYGYTGLTELFSIVFPGYSIPRIEFTNYLSPNNTYEYVASTWRDVKEIELQGNYTAAMMTALNTIAGVSKQWQIVLPDSHTITWVGYVSELTATIVPVKERIVKPFKIQLTSIPVWA